MYIAIHYCSDGAHEHLCTLVITLDITCSCIGFEDSFSVVLKLCNALHNVIQSSGRKSKPNIELQFHMEHTCIAVGSLIMYTHSTLQLHVHVHVYAYHALSIRHYVSTVHIGMALVFQRYVYIRNLYLHVRPIGPFIGQTPTITDYTCSGTRTRYERQNATNFTHIHYWDNCSFVPHQNNTERNVHVPYREH